MLCNRQMEAFKRMFPSGKGQGSSARVPPLRPGSASGSPRWAIRAASFAGGGHPFPSAAARHVGGAKSGARPFISPSGSPTGAPCDGGGGQMSRLAFGDGAAALAAAAPRNSAAAGGSGEVRSTRDVLYESAVCCCNGPVPVAAAATIKGCC